MQSQESYHNNCRALLLLAVPCLEYRHSCLSCHKGIGPEEFRELHAAADGPHDVLRMISRSGPRGVSWQNQILARAQVNHEIFLLSTLEDRLVKQMMVTPIHSVEEGLDKALKAIGEDAKIAVIPEGPLVLPVVGTKRGR